jgi:5-carboxymethyl-2-hydroxymuconate isomerase
MMADGNPDHVFMDITLRIGAGRDAATKTRALDTVFAAAEGFCRPMLNRSSFMLSMEPRQIDPQFTRKSSSIRQHLPGEDL